jgi:hypothetical protein
METTKLFLIIVTSLTILLFSCQNKQEETMSKDNNQNLIVLVKYKALPSRSEEAVAKLTKTDRNSETRAELCEYYTACRSD